MRQIGNILKKQAYNIKNISKFYLTGKGWIHYNK